MPMCRCVPELMEAFSWRTAFSLCPAVRILLHPICLRPRTALCVIYQELATLSLQAGFLIGMELIWPQEPSYFHLPSVGDTGA